MILRAKPISKRPLAASELSGTGLQAAHCELGERIHKYLIQSGPKTGAEIAVHFGRKPGFFNGCGVLRVMLAGKAVSRQRITEKRPDGKPPKFVGFLYSAESAWSFPPPDSRLTEIDLSPLRRGRSTALCKLDLRKVKYARALVRLIVAIGEGLCTSYDELALSTGLTKSLLCSVVDYYRDPDEKHPDRKGLIGIERDDAGGPNLWGVHWDRLGEILPLRRDGLSESLLLPPTRSESPVQKISKSKFNKKAAKAVDSVAWHSGGFKNQKSCDAAKHFVHSIGPKRTAATPKLMAEMRCTKKQLYYARNAAKEAGWVTWKATYDGNGSDGCTYITCFERIKDSNKKRRRSRPLIKPAPNLTAAEKLLNASKRKAGAKRGPKLTTGDKIVERLRELKSADPETSLEQAVRVLLKDFPKLSVGSAEQHLIRRSLRWGDLRI